MTSAPYIPPESVAVLLRAGVQRAKLTPVPEWGRIQSVAMPMSEGQDVAVLFELGSGAEVPVGVFRDGGFQPS